MIALGTIIALTAATAVCYSKSIVNMVGTCSQGMYSAKATNLEEYLPREAFTIANYLDDASCKLQYDQAKEKIDEWLDILNDYDLCCERAQIHRNDAVSVAAPLVKQMQEFVDKKLEEYPAIAESEVVK